jgi:2-(1,2-epoxy-1,2-dihydrophenyl)acetyl-CoA isomerase
MSDYENLITEQSNSVLSIIFNRPKANAFNQQMVDELLQVLTYGAREDSIRCLVLTGGGRFFSAGLDVTEIASEIDTISYRHHLERTFNRIVRRLRRLEKPIIGAINGPVAGASLGVALATDLRWAAQSASFVFGFTGIGLTADAGTSLSIPLLIGMSRAVEMAFTNQPLTAKQALDYGLVSRVVPDEDFPNAVMELATSLAAGPTRALGLTKRAFNRALIASMDDVLDYEAYLQDIAGRTDDHKEGVAAFIEKRAPNFKGS